MIGWPLKLKKVKGKLLVYYLRRQIPGKLWGTKLEDYKYIWSWAEITWCLKKCIWKIPNKIVNTPWHRASSKLPKSWPLSHTQQISRLLIIANLQTPWQMFLFLLLWYYINFNSAKYLITIPPWLEAKGVFSKRVWDEQGYFHQNHPYMRSFMNIHHTSYQEHTQRTHTSTLWTKLSNANHLMWWVKMWDFAIYIQNLTFPLPNVSDLSSFISDGNVQRWHAKWAKGSRTSSSTTRKNATWSGNPTKQKPVIARTGLTRAVRL